MVSQENDAQCMYGLLLYSLGRLYHSVERHAKGTGEWKWLVSVIIYSLLDYIHASVHFHMLEHTKMIYLTNKYMDELCCNSLKQDILDLGKPDIQSLQKLTVTSRMERMYDCLLPSLSRK